MAGLDPGQVVGELGIDQEHRGAGVFDDVLDLGRGQAEVDGHQDASPSAHPEERGQQARGVVGDDGHPFPRPDAQPIEAGSLGTGPVGQLGEGERPPRLGRLVAARRSARPGPG